MTQELKACPFCGTDDRLRVYSPFDDDAETVVVTCDQCNAEGPYYGGSDSTTPENAKALWNNRAPIPDRFTPLLEKAEAAIDALPPGSVIAELVEAAREILFHACIADAAPEDVDDEDRQLERRLRNALAKLEASK